MMYTCLLSTRQRTARGLPSTCQCRMRMRTPHPDLPISIDPDIAAIFAPPVRPNCVPAARILTHPMSARLEVAAKRPRINLDAAAASPGSPPSARGPPLGTPASFGP